MSIPILVATQETQGQRSNDFCWVPDGEPVHFSLTQCDREKVDGSCGCKRSMVGLQSLRATTTVKVALFEGDLSDLDALIQDAYRRNGYIDSVGEDKAAHVALSEANDLIRIASNYAVGTILEFRGNTFMFRTGSIPIPRKKGDIPS